MKAVVTVIGKDQKGIIAKISNILFENEVNILNAGYVHNDNACEFWKWECYSKANQWKIWTGRKGYGTFNPCAERRNLHINAQNIREVQIND